MTTILRVGRALLAVAVLSLPGLAAAEAPSELCDHEKAQDPTANKNAKQGEQDKSDDKKSDDKSEQKPDAKESDKS